MDEHKVQENTPISLTDEVKDSQDKVSAGIEEEERHLEEAQNEEQVAVNKLRELERDIKQGRDALISRRTLFFTQRNDKKRLKTKTRRHQRSAAKLQSKISKTAARTLQELHTLNFIKQRLIEKHAETAEIAQNLRAKLEEKYGHADTNSLLANGDRESIKLNKEQSKLQKIEESLAHIDELYDKFLSLLKANLFNFTILFNKGFMAQIPEYAEEESRDLDNLIAAARGSTFGASTSVHKAWDKAHGNIDSQSLVNETIAAIRTGHKQSEPSPDDLDSILSDAAPIQKATLDTIKSLDDQTQTQSDPGRSETTNNLNKYRRRKGDLCFYEYNGIRVVDAFVLVDSITKNINNMKNLFIQFSEAESPKKQFSVKQEIVWHQGLFKELMSNYLTFCGKENWTLPVYTQDFLNKKTLKAFQDKAAKEDWSKKDEFVAFGKLADDLKQSFVEKTTPPNEYINSISKELGLV